MKLKKYIIIFTVFAAMGLLSFHIPADTGAARVQTYQGLKIFIKSEPVSDYTKLGTVKKTGIVMSGSPTEMFETLCRRANKEYEDQGADGIIFDDVTMTHATVIKFK